MEIVKRHLEIFIHSFIHSFIPDNEKSMKKKKKKERRKDRKQKEWTDAIKHKVGEDEVLSQLRSWAQSSNTKRYND